MIGISKNEKKTDLHIKRILLSMWGQYPYPFISVQH